MASNTVTGQTVPADVDPQSGFRLPLPKREDLDEAGKRVYDTVADPKGGTIVGLRGPGGIQLYSPQYAEHARPLNRFLRYQSGLGERVRELAILVTAREFNSRFEWAAHEPEALRAGVAAAIIDVIKHRRTRRGRCGHHRFRARSVRGQIRLVRDLCSRARAVRPRAPRQSRGPHGQLCRDGDPACYLRHAVAARRDRNPASAVTEVTP